MEFVIWKFSLSTTDIQAIEMPENAMILTAQMMDDFIRIWAIVNPEEKKIKRTFEIIGTGHPITMRPREYIATVQDGMFVWHIFEINNKQLTP